MEDGAKQKKKRQSDLISGVDGGDVIAAPRSPGEEAAVPKRKVKGSQKRWERSSRSKSPPSNADEEAQVGPRRKKGKSMAHKSQMKEDSTSALFSGTDGGDLDAALHGLPGEEETARFKQRHRHSRRPNQQSSDSDGKTQEPGQTSAAPSRKKKQKKKRNMNKRLLHSDDLMEDGSAYLMPGSNDIVVLPKQKKYIIGLSDPPASHSCRNAQRAGKASADAGKGKNMLMGEKVPKILCPSRLGDVNLINKAEGDTEESTVVGNCLDGNLLMDRSIPPASHNGSKSEGSTRTQQKKPNISNPATGVKILVDHEQVQGAAQIQDLLGLDSDIAMERAVCYSMQLGTGRPNDEAFWAKYDQSQLFKVYQRLALYRIKDHELLMGKQLEVSELKEKYPPAVLRVEGYFRHYEKDLEWYFDPELCQRASLNDYQRLVIYDDYEYANWKLYRLTYHTYEGDEEYVRYCDEMSNATKWLHDKVGLDEHQWEKYKCIAYLQAMEIATRYHNIFRDAVLNGFHEYTRRLEYDYKNRKDYDGVYLEIWKRVAKDKMDFATAVKELYEQNLFPSRNYDIKLTVENYPFKFRASIKDNYDAFVACIDEKTSENEAHRLIIEAVKKMSPKGRKSYLDYARKKMEIAARIGLYPQKEQR